ncbi:MAG: hypothetical protein F6K56_44700 [Moorea sp. SIO3G5]|nr:hypothetical protein [Moorena sp. SIO3G5]
MVEREQGVGSREQKYVLSFTSTAIVRNFLKRHGIQLNLTQIKTLLSQGQFWLLIDGVNTVSFIGLSGEEDKPKKPTLYIQRFALQLGTKFWVCRDFGAGTEAVGHATGTEQGRGKSEVGRGETMCT